MEFRRYPKGSSRTVVAFPPLADKVALAEEHIICVDSGVLDIIRQLLLERGLWRTTYAIAYTDLGYFIPDEAEFAPVRQAIYEFIEDTNMADCGTKIKEGLLAVAASLQSMADKQCCTSPGGIVPVQGVTPGGRTSYGDIGGIVEPDQQGNPPEGFETWEEYFAYKCSVANWLADGLILTLKSLSLLSLGAITGLSVLIAASFAPFMLLPPSVIPVLIAAIVGLGVSIGILNELGQWLQDNRNDLVCALYSADSTVDAQDNVAILVDTALVALNVLSALHPLIRTVALAIASTNTLNQLFDGSLTSVYPNVDCDSCGEPGDCQGFIEKYFGEEQIFIEYQGDGVYELTVVSAMQGGQHKGGFYLNVDSEDDCYCVHIDFMELNYGSSNPWGFTRTECNGQQVGWNDGSITAPVGLNVNGLGVNSNSGNEFSYRVIITIPPA